MSKVGFITGATRGIGKQIAITLAKQGYDIAINYRDYFLAVSGFIQLIY